MRHCYVARYTETSKSYRYVAVTLTSFLWCVMLTLTASNTPYPRITDFWGGVFTAKRAAGPICKTFVSAIGAIKCPRKHLCSDSIAGKHIVSTRNKAEISYKMRHRFELFFVGASYNYKPTGTHKEGGAPLRGRRVLSWWWPRPVNKLLKLFWMKICHRFNASSC